MDLITQLQNYVGYLSVFMANSLEQIHTQAPAIPPPSFSASSLNPATLAHSDSSSSPTIAPPASAVSSSIPPPPQLDPAFAAVLDEKACQLVKRVYELQALIGCLPAELESEEQQMARLKELQAENEAEERRLTEAKEAAELWQRRVAHVVQSAAQEQLRIATQANRQPSHKGGAAVPTPSTPRKRGVRRSASTIDNSAAVFS